MDSGSRSAATATFSGLGQILEHVGDDGERIGLGGPIRPTGPRLAQPVAYMAVAHFAAVASVETAVAVGVGQVGAVLVVGNARGFGGW